MSLEQLTPNAIRAMVAVAGKPPAGSNPPVLQVINVKAVGNPNGSSSSSMAGGDRFRAVLSDGTHYVTGMLASQVMSEAVKQDCIVRVDDFMCNEVSNRHVIILLGVTVVGQAAGRIGMPVDVEKAILTGATTTTTTAMGQPPVAANQPLYNSTNYGPPVNNSYKPPERPISAAGGGSNPYGRGGSPPQRNAVNQQHQQQQGHQPIVRSNHVASGATPIAALNMYNNRWTIQARLTVKSDIKTWSNSKGEGSLFSIEMLDSSQDIRATFFKEAVDKFYHMLEVGKVYTFTGGRLKVANMQYNTCKSQYEITFDQNAEIHLANDDGAIEKQSYDFVKIAALEGIEANKNVDVLAVVKSVSEPANLISKKTGSELTKCDLVLVDDSGVEISLTIWGDKARTAPQDFAGQPVAAFRRARVGDYGGKSLSAGPSCDIRPTDLPQAAHLAHWWQTAGGAQASTRSLSASGLGGGGGKMDALQDRKPIASIKQENMGLGDKPDWLSFKATLSFLKKDKEGGAWYPACANPGEPCKNRFKCSPTTDNQWFCEKCQGTYANPVRRWIFSGVVEDSTSSTWVSFFNEQAETLLGGLTADQSHQESYGSGGFDQDIYDSVFAKALFTEWIFKCKVKNEFHNDESRVKTSIYSLHPVDYVKESNDLLAAIEQF